jgi:hypothetical protein
LNHRLVFALVSLGGLSIACNGGERVSLWDATSLGLDPFIEPVWPEAPSPSSISAPIDTVLDIANPTDIQRISRFAVSPRGSLLLARPTICRLFLYDPEKEVVVRQVGTCGSGADQLRSIRDVFWLDSLRFGVFDPEAQDILVFGRDGVAPHRSHISAEDWESVGSSLPVGSSRVL